MLKDFSVSENAKKNRTDFYRGVGSVQYEKFALVQVCVGRLQ